MNCDDDVILYHSGCNPKYSEFAIEDFIEDIEKYRSKSDRRIIIILDEFYSELVLEHIYGIKNVRCFIFTNDENLSYKCSTIFFYKEYFESFMEKIIPIIDLHQEDVILNIRQVLAQQLMIRVKIIWVIYILILMKKLFLLLLY